jgi:DNA-binding MarR family transcriptional regulator
MTKVQELKKSGSKPAAKRFRFGYLVHDVSRFRRTVMDQALQPLGITRSQWSVLSALSRGGEDGMLQADLARLLDVGKATVGGLIRRMEARGQVKRSGDVVDRRGKRVQITKQGYGVIEKMLLVADEINERIHVGIPPEHQQIAEDVLYAVKENLKAIQKEMLVNPASLYESGVKRKS